ncbi:hypothetical protein SLA2020_001580 [Shorea laevis]
MARLIFLYLAFLILITNVTIIGICNGNSVHAVCIEGEKEALLKFKQGIVDRTNRLASWHSDGDCCKWTGIVCDNMTGHVIELHLRAPTWDDNYDFEANYERYWRSRLGGPIPNGLRNLTSLKHLDLSYNSFNSSIPDWLYTFAPLEFLNLGFNHLQGEISSDIGKMNFVVSLDLFDNGIEGPIPYGLQNLTSLKHLDLSANSFNSSIPNWLYTFAPLESLNLQSNYLQGEISSDIGKMNFVVDLTLSFNMFKGQIPIRSIGNLCNLRSLSLSGVNLSLDISYVLEVFSGCVSNKIESLSLDGCQLYGQLSNQLGNFKNLRVLYLFGNSISGNLPKSFGQLSNLTIVDISNNFFEGPQFPHWLTSQTHLQSLDISNCGISSSLFNFLCLRVNETIDQIYVLNLGNNVLSGELPNCWSKWPNLVVIVLDNNRFTGEIPSTMGTLQSLESLHLHNNNLSGEIPMSTRNCTVLETLDFGENELVGNIPSWMGHNLLYLTILRLRSNKFSGHIPKELCALNFLHVLDVAHNKLSGNIPSCISNLSAMVYSVNGSFANDIEYSTSNFIEKVFLVMKGHFYEYDRTLNLVRVLDLSDNNLSGDIPWEITRLQGLQSLNLSHNLFTKRIPPNIGDMSSLESLDLSVNKLLGSIPESMSRLSFLSYLNLSNNQLSGKIPLSTQLQSFDASCYAGNELCGLPLMDNCSKVNHGTGNNGGKDMDGARVNWLFVSVALGFILGLWSVLSPLVISRQWRYAYYQYLNEMWWKVSDHGSKFF